MYFPVWVLYVLEGNKKITFSHEPASLISGSVLISQIFTISNRAKAHIFKFVDDIKLGDVVSTEEGVKSFKKVC